MAREIEPDTYLGVTYRALDEVCLDITCVCQEGKR